MKIYVATVASILLLSSCATGSGVINSPLPSITQSPTTSDTGILQNKKLTPGVTNPNVTQSNIHSTICVSGYTATIRPPSNYTSHLKLMQLQTGYTFNGDSNPKDYEEDHLISLEIGGSPTSPFNLWPEPYSSSEGAHVKDKLENKLHRLVCNGSITLSTAQHAISENWWAAYQRYIK